MLRIKGLKNVNKWLKEKMIEKKNQEFKDYQCQGLKD